MHLRLLRLTQGRRLLLRRLLSQFPRALRLVTSLRIDFDLATQLYLLSLRSFERIFQLCCRCMTRHANQRQHIKAQRT
jgi:hypothetical protein